MSINDPESSVLDEQSDSDKKRIESMGEESNKPAEDNQENTEEEQLIVSETETETETETQDKPPESEESPEEDNAIDTEPSVVTGEVIEPVIEGEQPIDEVTELINYDEIVLPPVDYSGYTRKELVDTLTLIVENRPPAEILEDVSRIKELFYKKLKVESLEKTQKAVKEGVESPEESETEPDELETALKAVLEIYRVKKTDYNRIQESEKLDNLKKKHDIIERIKDLVNREESINKTFQEFRNLQSDWRSTGIVPQAALKDMWESYHHSVEVFYDYIKINRELRDLDLKKNLESKIALCEKAEELFLEQNPVNAFKTLQDYHNQWREIGPVPHESKNDVWERFREATSKINKRHHEFFEKQKDEQKANLDAKTALCEKAEEIANSEVVTFNDFKEKSDAILECQKLWRTLGFAPKKFNNKIYLRFRAACDIFFEKKRTFFAESKEIQMKNLQLKNDLCLQAETLQESSEWKESTDTLIRLQKEWKEIGPVPKKYSEKVWKRFRKACDTFFTRKSEYFAGRNSSYEENLTAKQLIIDELEAFEPGEDMKAGFEFLKDAQRRWAEIGYVPINKKDEISKKYKDALNKQFDKIKIDDDDKNILRFRSKVDSAMANPRAARKVRNEREKYFSKIKQLEGDIVLWENNIGFFAKSSNADAMIKEVEERIAEAKRTIKALEEKVKVIDKTMLEEE